MRVRIVSALLMTMIVLTSLPSTSISTEYTDHHQGLFLDSLLYTTIENESAAVSALLNDELDIYGESITSTYWEQLEDAENIELAVQSKNSYMIFYINTAKNPFNYSEFRRAMAIAFNKTQVNEEIWNGLASPHDSPVPSSSAFSCEGLLDYNYYDSNITLGNEILDNSGFAFDEIIGFRVDPHGNPFSVLIEVAQYSPSAIAAAEIFEDALVELHIDAVAVPTDYYEYLSRLYFHGDFDIILTPSFPPSDDASWLAYDYWSEYVAEWYYNGPNWRNASYDSWREQLLHSTDYQDVYDAAFAMQEIWVYDCPSIVAYEEVMVSAYRTDRLEDFVNDASSGIPSWWTSYKVSPNEAMFGGQLRWGMAPMEERFSPFSRERRHPSVNQLYDGLMRQDPNGLDILWFAESYFVETHDDNTAVPEGFTRVTFDVLKNITWTDGNPVTAEDFAFTLNFIRDAVGNPYRTDLIELTAAYSPTTYRFVAEFSTESYWHLHSVCYTPILPKHVFIEYDPLDWDSYDPNPSSDTIVSSGPYSIVEYEANDFCLMTYNDQYVYSIDRDQNTMTSTVVTSETTHTTTIAWPPSTTETNTYSSTMPITTSTSSTMPITTSTSSTNSTWTLVGEFVILGAVGVAGMTGFFVIVYILIKREITSQSG